MATSILDANDRTGEHAPSWYAATGNKFQQFDAAKGDLEFDVAIIGAGFSGLSSALHLAAAGYSVAVVDAHRVGWGASGRNGGQVGTGQRVEVLELEKMIGKTAAKDAFAIGTDATNLVRDLIRKHKIDCDYMPGIIDAFHKKHYHKDAQAEIDHYSDIYGYTSQTFLPPDELREKVNSPDFHGGILDTNTGHLHPPKLCAGACQGGDQGRSKDFRIVESVGGPWRQALYRQDR